MLEALDNIDHDISLTFYNKKLLLNVNLAVVSS